MVRCAPIPVRALNNTSGLRGVTRTELVSASVAAEVSAVFRMPTAAMNGNAALQLQCRIWCERQPKRLKLPFKKQGGDSVGEEKVG